MTVNNLNADVFWNSWIASAHSALPQIPPPLTSNENAETAKENMRRANYNTASHATNESDFCPRLNVFEALVIRTGRHGQESQESVRYGGMSARYIGFSIRWH